MQEPLRESHVEFIRRCPVLLVRARHEGGRYCVYLRNAGGGPATARLTIAPAAWDYALPRDQLLIDGGEELLLAARAEPVDACVRGYYRPTVPLPACWDEGMGMWLYHSDGLLNPFRHPARLDAALPALPAPAGPDPA